MKNFLQNTIYTACLILTLAFQTIQAQVYKIGAQDVLSITFWQQPNLNTNVRVAQDGTIEMPVIGTITAAGLTPNDLATKIVRKISVYNKDISQAAVTVIEYGSQKIYVTGQVNQPGSYTFESIPNLWKIILEAGGPTGTAVMGKVKVIRGEQNPGNSIIVNLADAMQSGDISQLPPVYAGDTIFVPGLSPETAARTGNTGSGLDDSLMEGDIFYVYGYVARPGGYAFTEELTLLEAIITAGGPVHGANMKEVRVILKNQPYSNIATINLEQYSKKGMPAPFVLHPGDTIYIPQRKTGIFGSLFGQGSLLADVLRVATTAAVSVLIYSTIR